MNEFQTSLLLIGAVIVVGVFAYNKRQERQAARNAAETFRSHHPDVLAGESGSTAGAEPAQPLPEAPVAQGAAFRSPNAGGGTAEEKDESTVPDPRVDYVIEMMPERPIAGSRVLECWSGMESRFSRRAALSGICDGKWRALTQGSACERVRAMLQLVSRKGVLGEGEVLAFRSEIETLASRLGVPVAAPEMRESLDAARKLDAICVEADIQVAFHIVASGGSRFAGTKLRAASEACGLVLDDEGRFALRDERGRELFSLSDRSGARLASVTMKDVTLSALTLSMDVPRTPDTQHTFDAMVRFGRQLASLMDGRLVDDNDQPLDERAVAAIGAQLMAVSRALDAQGIAPGSALALRLFS